MKVMIWGYDFDLSGSICIRIKAQNENVKKYSSSFCPTEINSFNA